MTERLDHLSILAGVCGQLGAAEWMAAQNTRSHERVSVGSAMIALILNRLHFSDLRLYLRPLSHIITHRMVLSRITIAPMARKRQNGRSGRVRGSHSNPGGRQVAHIKARSLAKVADALERSQVAVARRIDDRPALSCLDGISNDFPSRLVIRQHQYYNRDQVIAKRCPQRGEEANRP